MNGRAVAEATGSELPSRIAEPTSVTNDARHENVIEADVRSVLEEMSASFKSFSETVFAKSACRFASGNREVDLHQYFPAILMIVSNGAAEQTVPLSP